MMPNRILKESITTSETLARITADEERLFWRLVAVADDFGRFDGRANIIRGKAMAPFLNKVKDADITRWMTGLVREGLIQYYVVDSRQYVQIVSWDRHQHRRAKLSKYPEPPPADASKCMQSNATAGNGTQMHADVPVFEERGTRNEEARNVFADRPALRARRVLEPVVDDGFEGFWVAYPRKDGKKDARKAWSQLRPSATLQATLHEAVARLARTDQWREQGGRFVPYAATFLRGERWTDEGTSSDDFDGIRQWLAASANGEKPPWEAVEAALALGDRR